jgi:hypothetical protein
MDRIRAGICASVSPRRSGAATLPGPVAADTHVEDITQRAQGEAVAVRSDLGVLHGASRAKYAVAS